MRNWQAMRKKLEQDYLAPCLRGRIGYFATTYRDSHDREGRAAILLDGAEILRGNWFNLEPKWPHEWDACDRVDETALEFGAFDQRSFYEAFHIFDNQSIEESLASENLLVRIFALLDRRVGKRRLVAMAANMERAPEAIRRFYQIRTEAENLMKENEVLRQLSARVSVRAFEDRPIAPEDREAILWAACQAPTAGNQQLYTIIDITDPEKKARLAETCDHQPFIARAPLVLVFCADVLKWHDAYLAAGCTPRENGAGDLILAAIDAAVAAQNAVSAAWSLGIGSCYIGDILENREAQRDILCLPDQVVPAVMLVFGYPTEGQRTRKKPERAAMKHIVHENAYRRMDAEELGEMLTPRAGAMPWEQWVRAFCARKFDSDFAREMTRSVREYLNMFD